MKQLANKKETIEEKLSYREPMMITEISVGINGWSNAICPRCDQDIEREHMKYCVFCGQRINWNGYLKAKVRYVGMINDDEEECFRLQYQ